MRIILFIFSIISLHLQAQITCLEYSITDESSKSTEEARLWFNETHAFFQNLATGETAAVDQSNGQYSNLINFQGSKIALASDRTKETTIKIEETEDEFYWSGLSCKSYTVTWPNMKMELHMIPDENHYVPYLDLPGIAVNYLIETENFTKRFVATQYCDGKDNPNINFDAYEFMNSEAFDEFMRSSLQPKSVDFLADFKAKDMDKEIFSTKERTDSLLILNFWYTQCRPCIEEMPRLNELKKKYESRGASFVAITFDEKYLVQEFLKSYPFELRIIPGARNLTMKLGIKVYPTTLLVDSKGKIIEYFMGAKVKDLDRMETLINQLLP